MAKINGKFLSGVIGPVKFSVRRGQQIVSKAVIPGTMRQSKATRAASDEFGKASSLSRFLRRTLAKPSAGLFSNDAINRLNGRMFLILKDCKDQTTGRYNYEIDSFARLEQLEFNLDSKVQSLMSKLPLLSLSGTVLTVSIPEQHIPKDFKFPFGSVHCELLIVMSLVRPADNLWLRDPDTRNLQIRKYQGIIPAHSFDFDVPSGCLCIISVFLNYTSVHIDAGDKLLKHKGFSPGAILGAFHTAGNYQSDKKYQWGNMFMFQRLRRRK